MDLLGVLKRNVEAVETHKARVEKFVDLEGEDGAKNDDWPRMTLVSLCELLVAWVLSQDHQEEKAEDEVAKELED